MTIFEGPRRWSSLVSLLFIVAVLALIAAGAMAIALLAITRSNDASKQAQQVATCLNDNLADRNGKGNEYDSAVSDAFDLFGRIIAHQVDSNSPKVRAEFIHDINTIRSVAKYRKAHPLGGCS